MQALQIVKEDKTTLIAQRRIGTFCNIFLFSKVIMFFYFQRRSQFLFYTNVIFFKEILCRNAISKTYSFMGTNFLVQRTILEPNVLSYKENIPRIFLSKTTKWYGCKTF